MLYRFLFTALATVGVASVAQATCSFPYTFSNGTTADANQVNANFNYTTNCFAPVLNPSFNGQVGIGTMTPQAALDIRSGSVYFANNSTVGYGILSNDGGLHLAAETVLGGGMYLSASSGFAFRTSYVGSTVAYLSSTNGASYINAAGGNVGIGTNAPAYALHVANGAVAGAGAYVNTSDARLKKDIEPVAYGLDAIMKLKPVGFNWKDQTNDWQKQRQIGLVAQDVQSIIPEVVSKANDEQGTLGLAYGELVPVLIKAIQDQQAEIAELKNEIASLKK